MEYMVCCVPVSPMRATASHKAEMVSQQLFGEKSFILEKVVDNWVKIQLKYDGYQGWVQQSHLAEIDEEHYVKTDKDGKFELHTIKPCGYPQSDLPAHIHVHIDVNGYQSLVTEFLFDDDERLVGKIRENSTRNNFLISEPQKTELPFAQKFSYAITLQK